MPDTRTALVEEVKARMGAEAESKTFLFHPNVPGTGKILGKIGYSPVMDETGEVQEQDDQGDTLWMKDV